jgi:hypothetical protein
VAAQLGHIEVLGVIEVVDGDGQMEYVALRH